MLIGVREIEKKFGIVPKVVLHVGAHRAEEYESMKESGWGREKTIWVESQVIRAKALEEKFRNSNTDVVLNATVWSKSGVTMTFYENSNSESSSLYRLGSHSDYFPDIIPIGEQKVTTSRLDEIISTEEKIDFVNLDIQGAELQALVGLGKLINTVTEIYTEVNKGEVYKECAKIWEIDDYLNEFGFKRIATRWAKGADWGDALYTRDFSYTKFSRFLVTERVKNLLTIIRYWLHDIKSFWLKS